MLPWEKVKEDRLYKDGEEFLAAVRIGKDSYEYHHISISCDEDCFDIIDVNGNYFSEWSIEDIDYLLPLPCKELQTFGECDS